MALGEFWASTIAFNTCISLKMSILHSWFTDYNDNMNSDSLPQLGQQLHFRHTFVPSEVKIPAYVTVLWIAAILFLLTFLANKKTKLIAKASNLFQTSLKTCNVRFLLPIALTQFLSLYNFISSLSLLSLSLSLSLPTPHLSANMVVTVWIETISVEIYWKSSLICCALLILCMCFVDSFLIH